MEEIFNGLGFTLFDVITAIFEENSDEVDK